MQGCYVLLVCYTSLNRGWRGGGAGRGWRREQWRPVANDTRAPADVDTCAHAHSPTNKCMIGDTGAVTTAGDLDTSDP